MTVSVRYYEFPDALANQFERAGSDKVQVALRVDGEVTDANILITRHTSTKLSWKVSWRVGPYGGQIRSDHWNMVGLIQRALRIDGFSDPIYRVYEQALNVTKRGWVVLTVQNGWPISAEHRDKL